MLFSLLLIAAFVGLLYVLKTLKSKHKKSFNFRVLTALVIGLIFGLVVQFLFGTDSETTTGLLTFMSIFGDGYVTLLKLIVIPLIFVAMTTSIMNAKNDGSLTRIAPKVIGLLLATVAIAALIGIVMINVFPVDAEQLQSNAVAQTSESMAEKEDKLTTTQAEMQDSTYADYILNVIPDNVVYMASGRESTATISTVLFSMFMGYSILQVRRRKPEKVQSVVDFLEGSKEVVLSMVREILKLTPFAILAIMASFTASSSVASMMVLFWFVVASYVAIIVMYIVHVILVAVNGLNPYTYMKKTWPVLLFGFGSRSSMAALPLNIETQTDALGVDPETASMSASFGTSIGQNGCAGIYPAMVAIMAAQLGSVEIDFMFIVSLIVVIAISSFGIAGVGGGATFAAVAVLTIMGLDVTVAAILVSVEPLIDMARTALNISDSMLSGVLTAKSNGTLDMDVYNSQAEVSE